jgi:hypothetical protein
VCAGALVKGDYLEVIKRAGFEDVRNVSESSKLLIFPLRLHDKRVFIFLLKSLLLI